MTNAAKTARTVPGRRRPAARLTVLTVALVAAAPLPAGAAGPYREPYRPQFHFTPARNWMNDPNGMVFFDGEFHLFYQYNPFGDKWGHMSWGHAVSRDLVHWQHLPVALPEADGVMIFSGSAVVDRDNTSGFGKDDKPPLVAIYTGHYTSKPLQNQHIAYSTDRGRTWTKYSGNPVLDIGASDFRDPKVFWHAPTKRWVMTVAWSNERKVRFYASPDLKHWTHRSDFGPAGATGGIWECPDLFPLVCGGKTRWVLIVNTSADAPAGGSGTQYFVGDFDGARFTLDPSYPGARPPAGGGKNGDKPGRASGGEALWLDRGPDVYAAVTWSDVPARDGRRLLLGWMANGQYAGDVPTSPWRSVMTVPRELVLRETPAGPRLAQKPVRELTRLRGPLRRFEGGTVAEAAAWLKRNAPPGEAFEIAVGFAPAPGGEAGLKLFAGGREATVVTVDRDKGRVSVDRTRSGNVAFNPKFSGVYAAPLPARDGRVRLHVLVDACSVEVFVNDGDPVLTALTFPSAESRGLELFGPGGAKVEALEVWPLASVWKAEKP